MCDYISELFFQMSHADKVRISKAFSQLLRHTATEEPTLEVRADGFIELSSILDLAFFRKRGVDIDFVRSMVGSDEKNRFSLKQEGGHLFIRANQGHSKDVAAQLEVECILTPIISASEIPKCVHGTNEQAWEQHIRLEGLKPMSRSHIHFAPGILGEEGVKSGMRKTASVHIYVDTEKAMRDGIKFYRSENDVILSDGLNGVISPSYFSRIEINGKQLF